MSLNNRTFWYFVLASVVASGLTVLMTAAIFRTMPQLRHHHPGFED